MQDANALTLKETLAVAALADLRIGTQAADRLHVSQPTLSRLAASASRKLGEPLFETGWSGSIATPSGEIVAEICQGVVETLKRSETRMAARACPPRHSLTRLKWSHFETVQAVVEAGGATAAARKLSRSQSAISQQLRDVQTTLGHPLFRRTHQGLHPLPVARELARVWPRIRSMLNDLPLRLQSGRNQIVGRIAVGMLPFSGQSIVARTLGTLAEDHPLLRLRSLTGPYAGLCANLRERQIDAIIGTMRGDDKPDDLVELPLYRERFYLVVNRRHPCLRGQPTLTDLAQYGWMVGPNGTPIRRYYEDLFELGGLAPPTRISEVLTFSDAEETIAQSDLIGILSYSDIAVQSVRPDLAIITGDFLIRDIDIGLTTLRQVPNPAAMQAFTRCLVQGISRAGIDVLTPVDTIDVRQDSDRPEFDMRESGGGAGT